MTLYELKEMLEKSGYQSGQEKDSGLWYRERYHADIPPCFSVSLYCDKITFFVENDKVVQITPELLQNE